MEWHTTIIAVPSAKIEIGGELISDLDKHYHAINADLSCVAESR